MLNDNSTPVTVQGGAAVVGNPTDNSTRSLWDEIDALKSDVAQLKVWGSSTSGEHIVSDVEGLANVKNDIAMLKQATGLHGLEESALALFTPARPLEPAQPKAQ